MANKASFCPECGSTELFWDIETGETACKKCGLVLRRGGVHRAIGPPATPFVLDLDGNLHYLVDYKEDGKKDPVYGHQGPVEIVEAERKSLTPEVEIVVRLRRVATFGTKSSASRPVYCKIHRKYELVRSEVIAVEDDDEFSPTYLQVVSVPQVREYTLSQVRCFENLIRRRGSGYQIREGVLAYLVCCGRGTTSFITGFLRASGFDRYKDVEAKTVVDAVGRIKKLGITPIAAFGYWRIWSPKLEMVAPLKINRIYSELETILRPEAAEKIREKADWWRILDAKSGSDVLGQLGLDRWL